MRNFLTATVVVCAFAPSARAEPPMLTAPPSKTAVVASAAGEAVKATDKTEPARAASATKVVGQAAAPVVAAPVKAAPPPPSIVARIDLSTQRMDVSVGGDTAHSWAISSGRSGYLTPTGKFGIQRMHKMWYSRKYDDAPMPHAVFFNGGIAVHGTSSTGMLGRPASHGCIRLAPKNAAEFYSLVRRHGKSNVRIEVVGKTPARSYAERGGSDRNRGRVAEERRVRRGPMTNGWGSAPFGGTPFSGAIYIDRSSPYYGRRSFVQNGVRYVRVR